MDKIKVVIADESRIVCEWIADKLSGKNISVVKTVREISELKDVLKSEKADVLLMNAYIRHGLSSVQLAGEIKSEFGIRVIIMSDYPIYPVSREYIDTECMFFWDRNVDKRPLAWIVEEVFLDKRYGKNSDKNNPGMTKEDIRKNTIIGKCMTGDFTDMDIALLEQLASGKTYEEIAKKLDLKINTVKYLISNMLKKTGYKNAITLVANAVMKKLIMPETPDDFNK